MKNVKVYYVLVMLAIIGLLLLPPLIIEAKEQPLPYTTPKISYQGSLVRISWYNTVARTYTVAEKREKCTKTYCTVSLHVYYRAYVPIGNTRIDVRATSRTHGQFTVY